MPSEFHEVQASLQNSCARYIPSIQLKPGSYARLALKLQVAYYPQGKTILTSRPPPGLAIIRKGAVRLVDDAHKFLDKRSEGELFGHDIYFHGAKQDYIAEAEEDCLLWLLSAEDFNNLCDTSPLVGEYFSSHLKKRVSTAADVKHSAMLVRDLIKT